MDKTKRRYAVAAASVLTAINITIIWGNSSMTAASSTAKSSIFAELLSHIFKNVELRTLDLIVRKCAHFAEFACLGMLSILMLFFILDADLRRTWSMTAAPIFGCLFVASTDEMIQVFSGRGNSVYDVMLDLSGSVFAIIIFYAAALLYARICLRRAASSAVKEAGEQDGVPDGDIADGTPGMPDDTWTDGTPGEPNDTGTDGTPGEPEDTDTDGEPDTPEE